ncbi:MAG TPA: PepSY domain-containing protein [Nevskiaceae bacterium]|nr:PepSY domain-containing protein [Nevskiaceae bacterium]
MTTDSVSPARPVTPGLEAVPADTRARWTMPEWLRRAIAIQPNNMAATLREWHKRAGLFAFLFMGWLGFSGFLINQSASWGYDTIRIDWGWVMTLYGLHPEAPPTGYAAGGHWLATTADYTLVDAQPMSVHVPQPVGFAFVATPSPQYFIASEDGVAVLAPDGTRIDELAAPILPVGTVRRIGTVKGRPDHLAVQDLDAFASPDGGTTWAPVSSTEVEWSATEAIPDAERQKLLPWSRPSVSLEHVLVDAHSGRLFGNAGAYLINTVGFAAIGLAFSGVWMWWRTRSRRRAAGR